MDPRDRCAKRQKWGRFLPHQRANVDQDDDTSKHHLSASNYGRERVGAPRSTLSLLSELWCT